MKRNFIFLVVCAYLGLTGCTDKTSHYVLKCHARQDVANVDDDAFMQIASKAIYDELQSKNKLSLLPQGANSNSLYNLYLAPKGYFTMGVSRHTMEVQPLSNIYVTYSREEGLQTDSTGLRSDLISFIVVFSDCGEVIDVL